MSEQDVRSVSSATGTYTALQQPPSRESRAVGNVAPQGGKEPPVSEQQRPDPEALTARLNVVSQAIGRDLRFKVDMNNGESVIQVLDRETGEIIREIPPEKAEIGLTGKGDVELRLVNSRV